MPSILNHDEEIISNFKYSLKTLKIDVPQKPLNTNLIGISGKKGSGKDLFYTILNKYSPGYEIKKFADKLKQICSIISGLPIHYFYDRTKYNTYITELGMDIRKLMQLLGTEAFRNIINDNVWINALFAEYNEDKKWIITDVRFPNEVQSIKQKGGLLVRVERYLPIHDEDNHESEIALDNFKDWDYTFLNNGTIDDYENDIKYFLNKFKI